MTLPRLLIGSIFCTLLASCSSGPTIAPVKGKVSFQGKAIDHGIIMFIPEQGPGAVGNLEKGGFYTLTTLKANDGAVVGNHKVTVQATQVGPGSMEAPKSIEEENKQSRSGKILVPGTVTWLVPEKYSTIQTTTLTTEVKAGPNTIDFDIKD